MVSHLVVSVNAQVFRLADLAQARRPAIQQRLRGGSRRDTTGPTALMGLGK